MRSRTTAIALVTAAVVIPLGVFGAPALARTASALSQYGHSGSSQYQYKVAICHHTHSKKHPFHVIVVSNKAVAKHMLRHGDTLAPCPTTGAPAGKHHGHGHGKGQGNGNDQGTSGSSQSSSQTGGSAQHGQSGESHGQSGEQHGQSGESHGQSGEQHGNSGGNGNGNGHGK